MGEWAKYQFLLLIFLVSDEKWQTIPAEKKEELDLKFEADGEFYMGFKDFLKYFGVIDICHLIVDSSDVTLFRGEWEQKKSSGGSGMAGFGINESVKESGELAKLQTNISRTPSSTWSSPIPILWTTPITVRSSSLWRKN